MAKRKKDQYGWDMGDGMNQSSPSTWSAGNQAGTSDLGGDDWGLPQVKPTDPSRPTPGGEGIDWALDRGSPPMNSPSFWGNGGISPRTARRLTLAGVVLAVLVIVLTLVFFVSGQTDYLDGQVSVRQRQEDSQFKLSVSYQLDQLEPSLAYAAGFLISPDGELPVAVSDPVFITGVTSYQLQEEITIMQAGDYRLLMYYYPLTDPIMRTTKPQLLQLRYTVAPQVTPDPDETHWYDVSTPTPSPSPTPTATPTPSPTPTPTPRPRQTPKVNDVPTVVPATPTPSPSALPTAPSAALFSTYPLNTRYYYFQMTDNEKRLFSEMYDAMAAFQSSVELKGSYTQEEFKRASFVLEFDCPEILYQASEDGAQISYHYWTSTGKLSSVEFVYSMTKAEADRTFTQVMDKIRSMQRQPGFGATDFSKQYVIYKYLIQHNYYNKEKPFCAMANSAWLLGYSKCSGYTRALNLALRYYGIQCCEIWGDTYDNGVISPVSHLWTGIKLDGSWYHCDATWDDPISDDPNHDPFARNVPELPYMNLNDDRMMRARSIHPKVIFDVPTCWNTQYNYYKTIGALIPAGSDAKTSVHNALTKAYQNGDNFFAMSFESARDYQTVMASLVDYLKSWRYGSTRYNGCSWTYWAEANLLYVYNIRFR